MKKRGLFSLVCILVSVSVVTAVFLIGSKQTQVETPPKENSLPTVSTNPTGATSEGTLIEDFENISQWAVDSGRGQGTLQADTTHFKQGAQGLNLNGVNGQFTSATKTVSLDLSAADNFIFWAYIDNVSNLNTTAIYLTSTTDWSKYLIIGIGSSNYITGWNRMVINKNDFTTTTGENWSNTMVRLRFRVNVVSGENVSVTFDDFRYN
jgi:hypothetical protein